MSIRYYLTIDKKIVLFLKILASIHFHMTMKGF
jgi:hypothetical protein